MPIQEGEGSFFGYRIGKGKGLVANKAYVLLVEFPEDVARSVIINNGATEAKRGFYTGRSLGDAWSAKYVNNNSSVIDVGTGAGFPGIPLKIYRTDLKVTLVDSLNKRLNFINTIIEELELKNVVTVHARAEEIGKNKLYREQFDVVTSRAVANLSILSEYLIPLAKINGKCLCMKGSEIEEELLNAKKAIDVLGGKIDKIEKFELPKSDIKRNVVLITKENKTPAKYPRKPGIPAKEPIM